jgi:hypothetical protein
MIYLTLNEATAYCTISGVTQQIINQASGLIDTYVGSLDKKQKTEVVQANNKSINRLSVATGRAIKGKLSQVRTNVPLVTVDALRGVYKTMFGTTYETLSTTDFYVDDQGHFTYYPSIGLNSIIYGASPIALEVTYTYGYTTPPEDLKLACSLICQNLARRGSFGAKSIQDFDVSLTFLDDSIITTDIRSILMRYRGV